MNTSDPYTLLRQAKDKCNDIVSFLFKHRGEETIEFLATAAYCNKILLLFLEECQPNESGKRQVPEVVHACTTTFYTLVRSMKEFHSCLVKYYTSSKVHRFFNKTRLQKQLQQHNIEIHTNSHSLEKKFEKYNIQRFIDAEEVSSNVPVSHQFQDADANAFWSKFGKTLVETEILISAFEESKFAVSEDCRQDLRKVLDPAQSGFVSVFTFSQFLQSFGPFSQCLIKLHDISSAKWFQGYLTALEAENLLTQWKIGTFLLRFSNSRPGAFAIAFVDHRETVQHILIECTDQFTFRIKERNIESGKEEFKHFPSIHDLIKTYEEILVTPLVYSLMREPCFYGDLTTKEAAEMLHGRPIGTYLLRFDEKLVGYIMVSFVTKSESIDHQAIKCTDTGFRFSGNTFCAPTLESLFSVFDNQLICPLNLHSVQIEKNVSQVFDAPQLHATHKIKFSESITAKANFMCENLFEASPFYKEFLQAQTEELTKNYLEVIQLERKLLDPVHSETLEVGVSESDDYDISEDSEDECFAFPKMHQKKQSSGSLKQSQNVIYGMIETNLFSTKTGAVIPPFMKSLSYATIPQKRESPNGNEEFSISSISSVNVILDSIFENGFF